MLASTPSGSVPPMVPGQEILQMGRVDVSRFFIYRVYGFRLSLLVLIARSPDNGD